jgi:phage-related protein
MRWRVTFFNKKVKSQALAFPKGILANFLHSLELLEEFGPSIGMPHIRPVIKGLYEIRAQGKEGIGRALYCVGPGRELVIVNVFVKKSRKTPIKEIRLAQNRMKEVTK